MLRNIFCFKKNYWLLLSSFLAVCILCISPCISCANGNPESNVINQVKIDADVINYSENTGLAEALGNVIVKNRNIKLTAPKVNYDAKNSELEAFSEGDKQVYFTSFSNDEGVQRLHGDYLKFNLDTKRGFLKNASGGTDLLFLKGNDVNFMSYDEAYEKRIVSKRLDNKNENKNDDLIAEWLSVSSTTCDFDKPHYRLFSKRVIIIPNKKIILKKPDIYIGNRKIIKYPFDYIISMKKKEQSLMPVYKYESNKGFGLGIKGVLDFNSFGELGLAATGWTGGLWEAQIRYQKELFDGLYIYGESDRSYNRDERETLWRPKWGLNYYTRSGWNAKVEYAQRELIETTMRPGQTRRYNVWKDPEFTLLSPTFGPDFARISMKMMYGRYQDNVDVVKPWVKRLGITTTLSGEIPVNWKNFTPYYGGSYSYYNYDSEPVDQKVTDAWVGIRWNIGVFGFNSMYFRRWVDGTSKLSWDNYSAQKNFYQTISLPLPIGKSWEKWNLSVTGTYDFMTSKIAEMIYSITYSRHCTTWQLWARDKIAGNEMDFRLTFYLNAFPEQKLSIGSDENN
ncbi:MAG: hypothetical protein RR370_00185 [Synergistaceae bacterium]